MLCQATVDSHPHIKEWQKYHQECREKCGENLACQHEDERCVREN